MNVRKLIESTLVSLDGVVEAPERWANFDDEATALALTELGQLRRTRDGPGDLRNAVRLWGRQHGRSLRRRHQRHAQAGGVARNGDKGHAYVTQPSGKRQTKHRFMTLVPLPGSTVVVPEKDGNSSLAWLNSLTGFMQTTVTLLTAYFTIQALVKK